VYIGGVQFSTVNMYSKFDFDKYS